MCSDLGYTEAKYYLQLILFTASVYFRQPPQIPCVSVTFADLLYILSSALPIPPRHARGLGLANLMVARPVGSYLLLSHAINSPPRHARGLG
jgi:hypothetical protein